jgi:hypothetical protein
MRAQRQACQPFIPAVIFDCGCTVIMHNLLRAALLGTATLLHVHQQQRHQPFIPAVHL